MVEEEVEVEVALTDLKGDLTPEVSKACAELDEKLGDVVGELIFEIPLIVILGEGQEVEQVGIL